MGIFGDDPGIPAGSPYTECGAFLQDSDETQAVPPPASHAEQGGFGHPHPNKLQLVYLT